jgi:hypothetical protein
LRGFNVIALEERSSFAPSNGAEPTGAFAPFQDAATTQHDAGVFAAHKRRLNWLRHRLGSLICFQSQEICGVKIPLHFHTHFEASARQTASRKATTTKHSSEKDSFLHSSSSR